MIVLAIQEPPHVLSVRLGPNLNCGEGARSPGSIRPMPAPANSPDADPTGFRVAVLGYGNQGRAHALNLRDAGAKVSVGARSGPGADLAQADGFSPVRFESAVQQVELVIMALPDEVHGPIWTDLEPHVPSGCSVGFIHGFSIHHQRLTPRADLGVILVAPKGPGPTLRRRFVKGQGIPALVGIHQTGEAEAELHLRRWGTGIGCARAALIPSSFAEECETDLFGEQAILCGGILALMRASFETLQSAGYSDEVAYIECIHELKQVVDLLYAQGPAAMHKAISNTAEFGAFVAAERLDSKELRDRLQSILRDIQSGAFAQRFAEDAAAGHPWFKAKRTAHEDHDIEHASAKVRKTMPWLENDQ